MKLVHPAVYIADTPTQTSAKQICPNTLAFQIILTKIQAYMSLSEVKYWCAVRGDFCNRFPLQNCGRVLPWGAEKIKDEELLKLRGEPCPEAVGDVTKRLAKNLHGGERCKVDITEDGRSYAVKVLEDNSDEKAVNTVGVREGQRFDI